MLVGFLTELCLNTSSDSHMEIFVVMFQGLTDKPNIVSRFEELFRQMWINNGNELSKMYAGTAALQGGSKVRAFSRSTIFI